MIRRLTGALLSLSLPVFFAEVEVLLTMIDTDDSRLAKSVLVLDEKKEGEGALITIDRSQKFQSMLGYGAALTHSSAALLMELRSQDEAKYEAVLEQFFSIKKGAGFRVLRLAVGASDYVATDGYWTYCDEPSPTLEGFTIAWDREAILPVLKDILKIAPDLRIIGTPWSAPAWMKENEKLIGVTFKEKEAGRIL